MPAWNSDPGSSAVAFADVPEAARFLVRYRRQADAAAGGERPEAGRCVASSTPNDDAARRLGGEGTTDS